MTLARRSFVLACAGMANCHATGLAFANVPRDLPVVRLETSRGLIDIELDTRRAPLTATHFLKLVEAHVYDGRGSFYRVVTPDLDTNPVSISVIQAGLWPGTSEVTPVEHESTLATGLSHSAGAVSMARGAPGTASTEFVICTEDSHELDFGGRRAPDGQGFAAFGRVLAGWSAIDQLRREPVSEEGQNTAVYRQLMKAPISIDRTLRWQPVPTFNI